MTNLTPAALRLQRILDAHGIEAIAREFERKAARIAELEALINTPTTNDWLEGVRLESAHQIERWGAYHDAGKEVWDWFWLIGYLAQKAAASFVSGNVEKAKHHTISTGAALLNWHRAITGENTRMRPGTLGLNQVEGS
jgi:hypothetical protein